ILIAKEKKGIAFFIGIYGTIVCLSLNLFEYLPLNARLIYFNLYTLLEYLFFAYLLSASIQTKKIKQIILLFSICFALFQTTTYFSNSNKQTLDSVSVGVETILLFIYILFFFYDHSKNNKSGYIYNHPAFWLSAGILIYLGGSFFFNILVNYMSKDEFAIFSHYTYIAEIIKNLFFTVAIWKISRQHKLSSIHQSQVPYLDIDMN
ncbi:MAG TPA: hypothetical protein VJ111_09215, partial [Chitinophagaceae bacterium]|nr:hypothetical protein [Chitinophagaceae bacterium]